MRKASTSKASNCEASWTSRLVVFIPYAWLGAFFLIPFLIVLKISLSQTTIAQPPYEPVFNWGDGWNGWKQFFADLSFDNYVTLASDTLYFSSYLRSLKISALSTLMLLVAGYPVAYAIARAGKRLQGVLIVLVMLPFWTSFLIRVYAWINILQHDGLLNQVLIALGIIHEPVTWLASDTAVYIGIVYSYFPFMILPLYASLQKMDETLYEAAADLGSPPWKTFWSVTVPLSMPGIAAGSLLCFIPIIGEFVIPDLLGGSTTLMIGQTLWMEFFSNRDWPIASAVALVLLCLLLVPILMYQRQQIRTLESDI